MICGNWANSLIEYMFSSIFGGWAFFHLRGVIVFMFPNLTSFQDTFIIFFFYFFVISLIYISVLKNVDCNACKASYFTIRRNPYRYFATPFKESKDRCLGRVPHRNEKGLAIDHRPPRQQIVVNWHCYHKNISTVTTNYAQHASMF